MGDKRKNLLDEMAIQMQKKSEELVEVEARRREEEERWRGEVEEVRCRGEEDRSRMEEERGSVEGRLRRLEEVEEQVKGLKVEIEKGRVEKKELEEHVARGQEEVGRVEREGVRRLEEVVVERDRERQVVELEWGGKCKDLQTQLELVRLPTSWFSPDICTFFSDFILTFLFARQLYRGRRWRRQ